MATRTTVDAPWGEPVNLGPNVNASGGQFGPSISNDGLALFYYWDFDIYMARRATQDDIWGPPFKLGPSINDHGWGTDNSLCDIGPMPWGDGVVDVEDLIVLAEHLFEEFPPVQ